MWNEDGTGVMMGKMLTPETQSPTTPATAAMMTAGCQSNAQPPQQELILINPIDYKLADRFYTEDADREAAMAVARANPGVPISVARILRTALVSLPNVEWSVGAPQAQQSAQYGLTDAQIKKETR